MEPNPTTQTAIVPPPVYPNPPPRNPGATWLEGLDLPDKVKPAFFTPDSKAQQVIVNDLKGFGPLGIPHVISSGDGKGNITSTKQVKKYAEALLTDAKTGRESVWEVLSLPAAVLMRNAVVRAGPDFRGNLVVEIRTEGRGMEKTFYVDVVAVARPLSELVPDPADLSADIDADQDRSEKDAIVGV